MGKYKSVKKAMHNNVLDRINMSLGASSSLDEKKAMREMKEELGNILGPHGGAFLQRSIWPGLFATY